MAAASHSLARLSERCIVLGNTSVVVATNVERQMWRFFVAVCGACVRQWTGLGVPTGDAFMEDADYHGSGRKQYDGEIRVRRGDWRCKGAKFPVVEPRNVVMTWSG